MSCLLSLRTKDEVTRAASKRLFARAKTPREILDIPLPELEELIQIARENGAIGAKLTGGGGGGTMVALCPEQPQKIATAMQQAGYQVIEAEDGRDALNKLTPAVKLVLSDLNMPNLDGIFRIVCPG